MSLTLLDWRRQIAHLYATVRQAGEGDRESALATYRRERDRLFVAHPESPLPAEKRAGFAGLRYWPYDPKLRFEARVQPAPASRLAAPSLGDAAFPLERIGLIDLPVGTLEVYWIDVYGGGVFLPLRDATSGSESYAARRYLLDTIKGADLGGGDDRLIIDFNYAYHPSCAYDSRWVCPLAPRSNWLAVAIEAGERL